MVLYAARAKLFASSLERAYNEDFIKSSIRAQVVYKVYRLINLQFSQIKQNVSHIMHYIDYIHLI